MTDDEKLAAVRAEEREACAKVAEGRMNHPPLDDFTGQPNAFNQAIAIAAAIRARREQPRQ